MTIEDVKKRVEGIGKVGEDNDEAAHSFEDDLYFDFVKHVANSKLGEVSLIAKEVLKTKRFDFGRWYA